MPSKTTMPILAVRQERAANALDISIPTFRRWVEQGLLPRPIERGGIKLWLLDELHAALLNLPRDDESEREEDPIMAAIAAVEAE